jgi:rfaE bifunctional protein kinase chain/domain
MTHVPRQRIAELLQTAASIEVAVIGDVMLDRYFWGNVARVSPEAPVPVVDVDNETFHLGGAANVAANLLSLGVRPLLCGVIGDDTSGRLLAQLAREAGLSDDGLVVAPQRPTTVKTRVIGNNQQIVRLDRETREHVGEAVVDSVIDVLAARTTLGAIILEDYDKGVLSPPLIARVITAAAERGIPVFVDPKHRNFWSYNGAWLVKPNRKEAEEALGRTLRTVDDVRSAAVEILERLHADNVLITLGPAGMMLVERDGNVSTVPTVARHVADVSGAGDTAIATLAALVAAGASVREAASIANIAAGVVVAEPGIVTVTVQQLLHAAGETE